MDRKSYVFPLICIIMCAAVLTGSRALFAPYLIAAIFGVAALFRTAPPEDRKSTKWRIVCISSMILAAFLALANYGIWLYPYLPDIRTSLFVRIYKLFLLLVIVSGGYFCIRSILAFVVYSPGGISLCGRRPSGKRTYMYFLIPFLVISAVYLSVYLCCYYPGLMSLDSIDQVTQIFTGKYSNHQPFYHTMMLKAFIQCALAVSGNINTAVAFYVIFQILFMSASFAFVIMNMAKLDMPRWCMVTAACFYALMPYHIMFSFTVWKDVLFGAFTTLLVTFFIRLMKDIGKSALNLTGFAVCSVVICLIRSNGLFAYVFVFLAMLLLMRRQKKILIIMASTIVISFILKHTVLGMLSVTPPDTVESLSIPLQQIARVVADDGAVSDEDMDYLGRIIDVGSIKDIYDPDISDPVKNAIRDFGNEQYLSDNMGGFIKLYLRTFVHNPVKYVVAWVDSTCGYWNSGYNYWVWYWDVEENDLGIARSIASPGMLTAMDGYLWLFYNNPLFQLFTCIGMFFWILLLLLAKNISDGNRCAIIACVPLLAIQLSLVISSPVYSEFRYMYALFCALPVLVSVSMRGRDKEG